jgi:hypothetical protein
MGSTSLSRRALISVAAILSSSVIGSTLLIGIAAPSGAAVTVRGSSDAASAPDRIVPLSASTCSDSVCIFVVGSGLNVSSWTTTVALPKTECSYAKFLKNGTVIATGPEGCGSSGEQLSFEWVDPGNFPNGTQLCNEWSGIAGEPCITVHS